MSKDQEFQQKLQNALAQQQQQVNQQQLHQWMNLQQKYAAIQQAVGAQVGKDYHLTGARVNQIFTRWIRTGPESKYGTTAGKRVRYDSMDAVLEIQ